MGLKRAVRRASVSGGLMFGLSLLPRGRQSPIGRNSAIRVSARSRRERESRSRESYGRGVSALPPGGAPGAILEASRGSKEAPGSAGRASGAPQEAQSELREVPGGFWEVPRGSGARFWTLRTSFLDDFRLVFDRFYARPEQERGDRDAPSSNRLAQAAQRPRKGISDPTGLLSRSSGGSRHSRHAAVRCLLAPALAVLAALSALALLALLARSLVSRASRSMIARFSLHRSVADYGKRMRRWSRAERWVLEP